MKIVLVTQNAPMYMHAMMERLLARRGGDIAGVVFTRSHGGTLAQEVKRRLAYYGLAAFVQTSLRILLNTALRRRPSTVMKRHGVARLPFTDVNSPRFVAFLRSEGVDVLLSIASMQIFRAAVLDAPRVAAINYHTALLPRHRGRQPLFYALAAGDEKTGITIHYMDEGLDTGDILLQREVPIEPQDTLHSLYQKSLDVGAEALLEALQLLEEGRAPRTPQETSADRPNRFPTRADRQCFRAAGRRFY
ncbi:MAG: methionyl-tRNA formyltransferase [Candidatus Brocadiia bacterium]